MAPTLLGEDPVSGSPRPPGTGGTGNRTPGGLLGVGRLPRRRRQGGYECRAATKGRLRRGLVTGDGTTTVGTRPEGRAPCAWGGWDCRTRRAGRTEERFPRILSSSPRLSPGPNQPFTPDPGTLGHEAGVDVPTREASPGRPPRDGRPVTVLGRSSVARGDSGVKCETPRDPCRRSLSDRRLRPGD